MISRAHDLHHQFSPPSPIQSSLRQAVGSTVEQTETGNRIIGGVSIFRSPVSAIRCLVLVFRFGCRFRKSVLCHRFSPPFISVGRWQPRVAGVPPCFIDSVICPLPSIQSSIQLCRDAVPTLPRQTRAVRGAAPTPRQALPLYSILYTRYSLCISPNRQPLTANHCLT
jgi:hypothetical protein